MNVKKSPDTPPVTQTQGAPTEMGTNLSLFKQVLEASGVAMSIRDAELRPVYANQAFLDFYGYSLSEIQEAVLTHILTPDTLALYTDTIIPTLNSGESWEGEYVLRAKQGRLHAVWGRFDPILGANGTLSYVISIMRDASTSMRLRNALTQTERHLKFLSENTSDCLFRLRLTDGRYDYISSAAESITGYTPQEFYETPRLFERMTPTDWSETFELWWGEFLAGKSRYEYESPIFHKNGTLRWINQRITVVKGDGGTPVAIEGIITDVTERRRVQKDLATAQNSLNFISNSTSDIFFKMSLVDGNYEYISPSVEKFSGYSSDEFMDDPTLIHRVIHPDWIDYFQECWEEHLQGMVRPAYDFQFLHKSGDIRWAHQRLVMIKDDSGTPMAIEGMASDTTESKRAEVALRASEEKFRFLAENITDVIWLMDNNYNFTYATPSVEPMWGYTVEELRVTDFRRLFTAEALGQFAAAQQLRAEAEATGNMDHENRLEMEHIRKDGSRRWVETTIKRLYDDDENSIGFQGVSRDITERKQAEAARKASEQKYRLLVENVSDVVWTQDNSAAFTYVTPSARALWGYSTEELMDLDYRDLFTAESRKQVVAINRARRKAEGSGIYATADRAVYEHQRKDGSTVWAESVVRRTFSDDGTPSGYMGVTRDVTERKLAEDALREGETRFRTLFEDSPISLWEEDLTRLKAYFDELKNQGITDFRTYFYDNPTELAKCAELVDVVAVNKATLELLRAKSQEDLLGNLDKVLTKSSMAAFTEEMILLASGGCEYCGEITHRTLEGDTIWVVVHFTVPPEYQGSLSRVIVSLIDVTPRKRAEQALMESEERYRALVENAQEGVVVAIDDKPLFVNEALSEILGYSNEELRQFVPFQVAHPDDREQAKGQMASYLSGQRKDGFATLRVMTKQGESKWITLSVKPIRWGGENAELKIITDISHYKALEHELRKAHAEMEERVRVRTAELWDANILLTTEVKERQKAQEQIISLTQQLIRIQEDERQRISRDLHDNVAQDLSSIVLNMETMFDGSPVVDSQVAKRSEAVTDIVRGAIAAVRDIAYGLRPPALDQLGLALALERHCEDVSRRTGVDIDYFATGIENTTLDFDTEINIYRMTQEALHNMAKHAAATRTTVRLVKSHPDLLIRIEDNGTGFHVAERMVDAAEERRMGLRSMEERARLIGGSMEIQSRIGTGTRIIFKIPITDARRQ